MTARQRWALVAAILGSAIVFLDSTIVNVALPRIGKDLPASLVGVLEGQTYVTSGYLATLAALLILSGALADYYGRRRIFRIGLVGFGLTSTLCGLAPTLELLAIFRVLQGAAGALLIPCSLALITATFEGPARARAFGIWAAATSAVTVVGPLLGGFLVDALSWRLAFLINVPLVVGALILATTSVEESHDEQASGRFDWAGAVVVALAVGGLAFGAIRGQQHRWADPLAWGALAAGALSSIAFLPLMARRRDPLVPLGLFRHRTFAVINLATFLIYGALYVVFGFQSLYLQGVLGYTALAGGAIGLPTGVLLTVLSTRIGSLAGRYGARRFLVAGPLLMAGGLLWFARIPASSAAWRASFADPGSLWPPASTLVDVLPGILAFGVGLSFVVAPLTSTLMGSVPGRNAGLGSAINNAISRVGQPLLAALIFVVLSSTFYAALATAVPGLDVASGVIRQQVSPLNPPVAGVSEAVAAAARIASTEAFHLSMLVCAALLVAGAVTNLVGLRDDRPVKVPLAAEAYRAD